MKEFVDFVESGIRCNKCNSLIFYVWTHTELRPKTHEEELKWAVKGRNNIYSCPGCLKFYRGTCGPVDANKPRTVLERIINISDLYLKKLNIELRKENVI